MITRHTLRICASAALLLGFELPTQALDRWSALAMIESGNNDGAVGAAGEVSRYQIKPAVWRRYAPAKGGWENPRVALLVARQAMRQRIAAFEREHRRSPTDFEFYVLWNAPAQVVGPSKVVSERARRFCNLVRLGVIQNGTVNPPSSSPVRVITLASATPSAKLLNAR
jgi:hypothetical protein